MADDRRIRGYAEAILAVAEAEGALDAVQEELFRFARTVEEQGDLREALTDIALPAERKRALIRELLGDRASDATVNLLELVVEQGRARDLSEIADELVRLAAERGQQAVAEVRTAIPLDEERRRRLAEALERATGRRIDLRAIVDEAVVGGVYARVGDQVFDGTVRRRLELARERMSEV
ncbi:MAG TPA: ATP synthase F1 subunit delta [Actinomycetota bacterium]|nr:ATP synthase F1 subunit delta [Actinomycetota bacterium]